MLNVAYRVFLYSYAYIAIVGNVDKDGNKLSIKDTLKKIFLNPIIIATLLGMILWFMQAIPGSDIVPRDWLRGGTSTSKVAFWRIDVTLPWIYQTMTTLGSLSSPLVWLAIGCTLGNASIKDAATDKLAWIYSVLKVFAAPIIVLVLLLIAQAIATACGNSSFVSIETVQSSVMMWMVPPATVAVAYCINYEKEKALASNSSVISTLVAVPGIVFWVLILTVISSTGFFPSVAA